MGGIKNKLSKQLSNKTIPLSGYRLTSPFSQRGTKSSLPLAKEEKCPAAFRVGVPLASQRYDDWQMSVAHRWGRITKYLGITCLTLAILSTLVLNIVSSYSYSKVNSNAEPVSNSSTSTLANTEQDPTGISISISSYSSSSSTGSNDPNLSLSIPQGGGIATGRHTVEVSTGSSVIGYELQLSSNSDETGLVNNNAGDNEGSTSSEGSSNSNPTIPTTTGAITNPSTLADKTYGYTLSNIDSSNGGNSNLVNTNIWLGLQPKDNPDTVATVNDTDNILTIGQPNEVTHNIYYGVNVQNPVELRAGNYSREVVYTAIAELMPEPEVTDLVLNSSYIPYYTGMNDYPAPADTAYGTTSILTGTNLSSITNAWIDMNDNGVMDGGEETTNLIHATGDVADTKLTFEAPSAPRQSIGDQYPEGQHDVYLEWGGGDPVKIENGWSYIRQSECVTTTSPMDGRRSDCIVDIDDNMIPVYYSGDETNPEWSLVADCTDYDGKRQCGLSLNGAAKENGGFWYDYSAGEWANAVTLRNDFSNGCYVLDRDGYDGLNVSRIDNESVCQSTINALTPLNAAKEAGRWLGVRGWSSAAASPYGPGISYNGEVLYSLPLHPDDILGYWVYIPRYSYEVMRRDAIDLVQQPEDFKIKFETADTTKKVPVEGCSDTNNPKSYRVGCSLNRTYTNTATNTETNTVTNTTWATHPAFTWMDEDGNPVELNGIWVGKFETTGSTSEPTVLPNEKHMSLASGNIGDMYDVAKSMGIEDKNNKYGNTAETNLPNQNNNNLVSSPSHMLKNSEWGAVAYLSASRYGIGVNKVQINGNNSQYNRDSNDDMSLSITGCGPQANGNEEGYDTFGGTLGANNACGSADKAYNGVLGKYASTTGNEYGIYDMAGGAYEYVTGSYTTNSEQSSTSNFKYAVKPPYVDLYVDPPFSDNSQTNNNKCTWTSCGGHALYETKNSQSVSIGDYYSSWGDSYSGFVDYRGEWFRRGGSASYTTAVGIFQSSNSGGISQHDHGFRAAVIAN